MTVMRVRRSAQLALPANIRRALNVREGDFLDAEIVEGGVLLKAVGPSERQRAWDQIGAATAKVVDLEADADSADIRAEEEAIADAVRDFRRRHA